MRKLSFIGLAIASGILAGCGFGVSSGEEVNENEGQMVERGGQQINRANCVADDCLQVEGLEYPAGELDEEAKMALDEAINDEYKALATYEKVVEGLGAVRPFVMIKGAEEQHIASLKALYDKYGVEVPENEWIEKVSLPVTLEEACQIGVEAEIANADLYREKLLPAVADYEDITQVFTNLMKASEEKHLVAFERCN